MARPATPIRARFWPHVTFGDGCWEWGGGMYPNGYGRTSIRGRSMRAHRVSWLLANGTIPTGLHVCHRCDNRRCVRPDHLFLGTAQENIDDKVSKGRQAAGRRHGSSRLTESDVIDILSLHAFGAKGVVLAREYGVGQSTVSRIVRGHHWGVR